jgi:peptide/nickel transport system substrate-binding protein
MIQPTRRALLATFAAASLPGTLHAQTATPRQGGSISMVPIPEPARLQTAIDTGVPVQLVSGKMHNGLLNYDMDMKPVPELAESWEIAPDGLTITFHLRRGVTFHDGHPMTSADVKFTIEKVSKVYHSRGRGVFLNLTTIDTPDEATAIFRLSRPAPYIMTSLHASETPILPKHIYEVGDIMTNPANNAPIGTGPFRFKEWKRGSYILLERNDHYFVPGQPHLDQIVFKTIPDSGARAVAFESGELDIGGPWPVSMTDLQRYKDSKTLKVTSEGYASFATMDFLEFNLRVPLFQDVRVRRAIAHCIDRGFIVDNILYGFGKAATGPVSSDIKAFYTPDVPSYPLDTAKAEALLDEAGHKRGADGTRFTMTLDPVPYGDRYEQMAEYIAQALAPVGIKAEIRQQDVASWLRRVYTTHDCQAYIYGIYNMSDPTVGVQRQYWSQGIKDGVVFANGSSYSNPRIDAIFAQAAVEASQAKRKELFDEMQRIIVTDLPNIALVSEDPATVYNRRVLGAEGSIMGIYDTFANVGVRG